MVTISNIKRFDNIPFVDYLQWPQYSHSFLKREKDGVVSALTITDNIRVGALVDDILTRGEVDNMDSALYPYARDIAAKVKTIFGPAINSFQKQVSYTGDMACNGFVMPVKGRLDFLLPNIAVVDLKVTKSKDLRGLIDFMGYANQGWNYCQLADLSTFYLMIYSIPLKRTELIKIDCSSNSNAFYEDKILKFGRVQAAA